MAVNFEITGGGSSLTADVVDGGIPSRSRPNGLVVYTTPYEVDNYEAITGADVDGNTNLAINGTAYAATVENIHNGIDNAYWTSSATTGTWTFNSATQAHSGTNSISGVATVGGDVARFDAPASIDSADYEFMIGWIYITSLGTGGGTKALNVQVYNSSDVALGNTVNIYDYVNLAQLNVWQKFEIPLSDFGSLGNDLDRMDLLVVNTSGQAVDFYLDDWTIESVGGREFFIKPTNSELTHITKLEFTIAATDATTRDNDLNPIGFGFGSALTNGLKFKRNQTGYPVVDYDIMNNLQMLSFPGAKLEWLIGDGTTAAVKFSLNYPVALELNNLNNDYLSITVADNLSSNISITFTAVAHTVRKPDLTSF